MWYIRRAGTGMKRLFSILSVLSLLLFVAAAALWARSYLLGEALQAQWDVRPDPRMPHYENFNHAKLFYVQSAKGKLLLYYHRSAFIGWDGVRRMNEGRVWNYEAYDPDIISISSEMKIPESAHSFAGFRWGVHQPNSYARALMLPWWAMVFPGLTLPAVGAVRKRRATRNNLCTSCGYDLRATPDRCPECGGVVKAE